MTFSSIQLRKEARPLLLPWIAIMCVGALSLFHKPGVEYYWRYVDILSWILPLGCFFAIPLLAALPLGSEFQHGTFSLLLSQPVNRQTLWLQKTTIALLAVLPATALFLLSARINPEFAEEFWPAAVWIFSSVSGSVAGTLIARSTIGGLALSSAFQGLAFLVWDRLAESQRHSGAISPAFLGLTAVVLLCYAIGMVLLGRRTFLRFQAIDGGHTGFDGVPGANFLSRMAAGWLRCRSRGALLNLLRREFYLLRTVWLLGLLSLFTWIFLVIFGILRPNNNDFRAPVAAGIAATLSFAIAILAGALSLGEEKNWGTHSWQLTLPVSPSIQWLTKLLVAVFTSVICATLVPLSVLLVSGWLAGSPLLYFGDTPGLWFYPLASVLITLMAFWASCAVKGTVPAVVTFFFFLFGVGSTVSLSPWLTERVTNFLPSTFGAAVAKLDPVAVHHFLAVIIGAEGGNRLYFAGFAGETIFSTTLLLLVSVGLMQSRRLFRTPSQSMPSQIARRALPLLVICLLPNLAVASFFKFSRASWNQEETMWAEVHNAIEAAQSSRTNEEAIRPQRLTLQDLTNAAPLSDSARKWLNDSQIVVVPEAAAPQRRWPHVEWPYESAFFVRHRPGRNVLPYSAAIRTASGHQCNLRFLGAAPEEHAIVFVFCQ